MRGTIAHSKRAEFAVFQAGDPVVGAEPERSVAGTEDFVDNVARQSITGIIGHKPLAVKAAGAAALGRQPEIAAAVFADIFDKIGA